MSAAAAVPSAARRGMLHNYVHGAPLELSALQGIHGGRRGFVVELDESKAACTARTIAGDP